VDSSTISWLNLWVFPFLKPTFKASIFDLKFVPFVVLFGFDDRGDDVHQRHKKRTYDTDQCERLTIR
jgi:hypothetical protein